MSRRLTRRGGHAVRGTRTLCGKPAPASSGNSKITCSTCNLILSSSHPT